jgi:AcrR family transcriptional regulator
VKLNERLVRPPSRGGAQGRTRTVDHAGQAGHGGRKRGPATAADPSRDRVLAAAASAFAAHGFAGTSVDQIAAAARLNKAMIYYHFQNKAELYRFILRDMFRAFGVRVRDVAASDLSPVEKIRLFIATFAAEAEARPHFPPIWFREIADGGAHLDDATLADMAAVLKALTAILEEGVRGGAFKPVSPLLVHGGIVAPVLLFFASAGIRGRVERAGVRGVSKITREQVVAHAQRVTLALLEGRA